MADQILDKIRDATEGQIDFEGQRTAEVMATALLSTVGGVAFIVGFQLQDIKLALQIALVGTALIFVAVVPPWPFFNKNPVDWLPVAGSEVASQGIMVDGRVIA